MKTILFIFCALSFSGFAKAANSEHRELGAHVHGHANLSLAFEGLNGKLEFRAPSDSMMGFEHEATDPKDIKAQETSFIKFDLEIKDMVSFAPAINCVLNQEKIYTEFHGEHGDFVANYNIKCTKSPEGTSIRFEFQKYFPQLKITKVVVLIGSVQKTIEVTNRAQILDLKPLSK